MPGDDPALISKQQLFARIVGGLGGRAAEEVIFGESEITTGAAGDLQQITQIARQVYEYIHLSQERSKIKGKEIFTLYVPRDFTKSSNIKTFCF